MGYRTAEVQNESGVKVRLSPQQLEFVQLFLTKEIIQIDINKLLFFRIACSLTMPLDYF